jgi:hypothetical protein
MTTRYGYIQEIPDWFDPAKYQSFDLAETQPSYELRGLWYRALLVRRLIANPNSQFPDNVKEECINRLITNPADFCGFDFNFAGNRERLWDPHAPFEKSHPYGQGTVYPTRWGEVEDAIYDKSAIA